MADGQLKNNTFEGDFMTKIKYIMKKLKDRRVKDIKFSDLMAIFPMTLALLLRPFYKNKYRNVFLVCEEPAAARDNGYHFFKFMREKHPEQPCVYAIRKNSADRQKVLSLGTVINFGSLEHWLAYFLCKYNISTQKGGKPNDVLCIFGEQMGLFKARNVLLQHGITINNVQGLYAETSNYEYFFTAAAPETEFIKQNFGYKDGVVKMVGFPRFDALHDFKSKENRILIMPTWRSWLKLKSKSIGGEMLSISSSEYFQKWLSLLNSHELDELIEKYSLDVIFYPHWNMQAYIEDFKVTNSKITVASWQDYDVQELMKTSKMMITDYSSVFFDMVYMKKPIIFYQFDEEKFRKLHYGKGWFDYHTTTFGYWCNDFETVLNELEHIVKCNYSVSEEYLFEHKKTFTLYDNQNSERIYRILRNNI